MYNKELNDRWVDKLRATVAGKRVLMVGNSTTMFSKKWGDMIDSYDFVVRFGKGIPYKEYSEYLGTKTDMWFFGTGRAGMWKDWKHAPFKLFTMAQINIYNPDRHEYAVHRDMMDGTIHAYRDFFIAGTSKDAVQASKDVNGDEPDARISQGTQCIHYFANHIKTYKSIDLVGFDFFGAGFTYNYDTTLPRVPKHQPTTSWHMPLVSKAYDENPHSKNGNEERYIRSVPNLYVHEMPPIDMENMEMVLKRLRGTKATITGDKPE